jgi:Beta-galactosidase/beta-glucuronidase
VINRLCLALPLFAFVAFGADWKPADSPLTTPWTAKVSPRNALPEYPRPQLERKQWINLNGLWDYTIQPKDDAAPRKFEGQILVPFAVESSLSGVKRALKPDQRLWYRRTFTAPDLKGKRLLLHFGAVDWRAEVFINGKPAGAHEGGYDPFTSTSPVN